MYHTVLDAVLHVFSAIGEWIADFVPTLFRLFWTEGAVGEPGELTFLGVLAVAGLAFSVIFLNSTGHYNSDVIYESSLIAGNS